MNKKIKVLVLLFVTLIIAACSTNEEGKVSSADGEEIIVSAAASLTDVLREIQTAFNDKYPDITVTYNFGGSGKLIHQIQNGAPADVFLSASETHMNILEEAGLIDSSTRFPFVKNRLALIAPSDSKLAIKTLEELRGAEIEHFIIGDPDSVPAGRYGKQALETARVWKDLDGKTVYASDVRQVLTQVQSGNGEAGIVFVTDVYTGQKSRVVLIIDEHFHDEIIYPAAIVTASTNKEAARKFLDFLKSEEVKAIFNEYGFIAN